MAQQKNDELALCNIKQMTDWRIQDGQILVDLAGPGLKTTAQWSQLGENLFTKLTNAMGIADLLGDGWVDFDRMVDRMMTDTPGAIISRQDIIDQGLFPQMLIRSK